MLLTSRRQPQLKSRRQHATYNATATTPTNHEIVNGAYLVLRTLSLCNSPLNFEPRWHSCPNETLHPIIVIVLQNHERVVVVVTQSSFVSGSQRGTE
jgi:hypothetical protein